MNIDVSEIKNENVIPFERKSESTIENHTIKKPENLKSAYCRHRKTELDSENREIICRDCGSKVDPFDWVKSTLEQNAKFWNERASLQKEIQRKELKIEELRAEETKVKSRLRNARESLSRAEHGVANSIVAKQHFEELQLLLNS